MEMQTEWANVKYLIVDEISMVSQVLLGSIDERLSQIFPLSRQSVFGGLSVLMFGDFAQLSPVAGKSLFSSSTGTEALAIRGRWAYCHVNAAFFLDTVVRQEGDTVFKDLLLRVRNGDATKDDWKTLSTRTDVPRICSEERFRNAIRLYPMLRSVFVHNLEGLRKMNVPCAVFEAVHPPGRENKTHRSAAADKDEAGGLEARLALCVGAKVMLVSNLWVNKGLVNGSVGVVRGIVYAPGTRPPQLPRVVFAHFPCYTGPCYQGDAIPILPVTTHWQHKSKQHCARTQFPLSLCWATTIHKSQGLTLNEEVAHLGTKEMCYGMTYVVLSRVRAMSDLCLYPFNLDRLMRLKDSSLLAERKKEEARLRLLSNSKKL